MEEDKVVTLTGGPSPARIIFERVRIHLLRQNRAASRGGECAYQMEVDLNAPVGTGIDDEDIAVPSRPVEMATLRCAVGCLITDEAYDDAMEGSTMDQVRPTHDGTWMANVDEEAPELLAAALNDSGVPADPRVHAVLTDLQELHDENPPETWPALLDSLSARIDG